MTNQNVRLSYARTCTRERINVITNKFKLNFVFQAFSLNKKWNSQQSNNQSQSHFTQHVVIQYFNLIPTRSILFNSLLQLLLTDRNPIRSIYFLYFLSYRIYTNYFITLGNILFLSLYKWPNKTNFCFSVAKLTKHQWQKHDPVINTRVAVIWSQMQFTRL